MQLPEIERQIITLVVRQFAEANRPTEHRDIYIKFKPHGLDAVHRIVAINVLRDLDSEKLIPNVVAFSLCGRRESELQAKSSFEIVLPLLQHLYETTPKNIVPNTEILKTDLETKWPTMSPNVMWLGLYQCHEMGFVGGWSWEKPDEVQSLRINARVMSTDATTYWEMYVQKQTSAVQLFLRNHMSQRFLQGISDLAQGREEVWIAPINGWNLPITWGLPKMTGLWLSGI